jgi:hypothetical protein
MSRGHRALTPASYAEERAKIEEDSRKVAERDAENSKRMTRLFNPHLTWTRRSCAQHSQSRLFGDVAG